MHVWRCVEDIGVFDQYLHNHFTCGPSRVVVASFLLMKKLFTECSLTFGASCFIQSVLLAKEHYFIRYLSENWFKVSIRWLLEIVSTAPGDLFGASWSNQDALRCVGRLDRSILRVELATKLILVDLGSIFGAWGRSLLGSKMRKKSGRSARTNFWCFRSRHWAQFWWFVDTRWTCFHNHFMLAYVLVCK